MSLQEPPRWSCVYHCHTEFSHEGQARSRQLLCPGGPTGLSTELRVWEEGPFLSTWPDNPHSLPVAPFRHLPGLLLSQ